MGKILNGHEYFIKEINGLYLFHNSFDNIMSGTRNILTGNDPFLWRISADGEHGREIQSGESVSLSAKPGYYLSDNHSGWAAAMEDSSDRSPFVQFEIEFKL